MSNKSLAQNMYKKGWTPKEVEALEQSLERYSEHSQKGIFEKFIYWTAIIIAIIGNFAFGVVFIPFLLVMKTWEAAGFIILIGVSFGYLYLKILKGLEGENEQQVIAWIFLPVLALITVYIITSLTNKLAELLQLPLTHSPIIIGTAYALALTLPYIIDTIKIRMNKKQETTETSQQFTVNNSQPMTNNQQAKNTMIQPQQRQAQPTMPAQQKQTINNQQNK